jgi:hypothetical protein
MTSGKVNRLCKSRILRKKIIYTDLIHPEDAVQIANESTERLSKFEPFFI